MGIEFEGNTFISTKEDDNCLSFSLSLCVSSYRSCVKLFKRQLTCVSITGLRNQHTKWTRLEEQDAHVTYTRLTQMKYTQKGENIFLSFFKNPSYMSCRGTFEYLVARWNVLFPFGLDLLTHTQTHRDIRRNERKKKKKKKTPKNV